MANLGSIGRMPELSTETTGVPKVSNGTLVKNFGLIAWVDITADGGICAAGPGWQRAGLVPAPGKHLPNPLGDPLFTSE